MSGIVSIRASINSQAYSTRKAIEGLGEEDSPAK